MFIAVGVGARRHGTAYEVLVEYFDDRVNPRKSVGKIAHEVDTQADLMAAVADHLALLRDNDREAQLNTFVSGRTLGTI